MLGHNYTRRLNKGVCGICGGVSSPNMDNNVDSCGLET